MRIIFISDLHGSFEALRFLPRGAVLIVGGDITQLGTPQDMREAMALIADIAPRYIAVSGNMDPPEGESILAAAGRLAPLNISVTAEGHRVRGLSGSNITPGKTPFEWEDDAMRQKLGAIKECDADIFVTHAPPYASGADVIANGMNVGSHAVAEFVTRFKPALVLCGHIHEAPGIFAFRESLVVNPGAFGAEGHYADIRWMPNEKPSVWLARAVDNKS